MSRQVKYVFVTGGVVSSLGKGITAASLGRLLKARGLKVVAPEVRPLHQRRPGHDEPVPARRGVRHRGRRRDRPRPGPLRALRRRVPVARLQRHHRRHLQRAHPQGAPGRLPRRDRAGDPARHQRDQEPHPAGRASRDEVDVVITEIGGTVGDIESLPFLEAIRQFRKDVGRDNVLYIHCTLVPFIDVAGELKTKPTQHSVQELRRIGIQPDVIVCRSEPAARRATSARRSRSSATSPARRSISAPDADDIYAVPLIMQERGARPARRASGSAWSPARADMREWEALVERIDAAEGTVRIALVGKYVQLQDAYLSVVEALKHAAIHHGAKLEIVWVDAETLTREEAERRLAQADGVLVPGGFGVRGIEGKIAAARFARENRRALPRRLPRHAGRRRRVRPPRGRPGRRQLHRVRPRDAVPGDRPAARAEGGRGHGRHHAPGRRAGEARARAPGPTRAYGEPVVYERHRHRYEVNNSLRPQLEAAGLRDQRHLAGRAAGRDHRAARPPVVRAPASSTPSSSRGPTGRSRSSATSSARRSPAAGRRAGRAGRA